jgi:LysR family transcriptional regulator, nitrogen assimilation regulatory protein
MFNELLSEGGLSLDRLKNFCAVAEAGGIARVAGGDPAKQSLYSRQLRELEQFFGAELTRRKGKGIEFTEQGLELARQVRVHLQSLADFKKACAGLPVEFRIASGNSIVEWLVVPNISKITAGAPSARFSFHDMWTADVIRGLREHSMDFGILRKSAVVAPLKFHSIGQIGYALFAPAPWAKERENATTLLSQRPVAVPAGGEPTKRFQECCEKAKLTLNLRFGCASFTQAAELVRTGHAVALLPEMAASSLLKSGVKRFEFAPMRTYRREIGIVWHPRLVSLRPQAESVLAGLKRIEACRRELR